MIIKESLHETGEKTLIVIYLFSLCKAFCYKSCFISFYILFGVTCWPRSLVWNLAEKHCSGWFVVREKHCSAEWMNSVAWGEPAGWLVASIPANTTFQYIDPWLSVTYMLLSPRARAPTGQRAQENLLGSLPLLLPTTWQEIRVSSPTWYL